MDKIDLLPCCQCGESKGYSLSEGSTYRWWVVTCRHCGGDFGECAADRKTNLHKDPFPKRWGWADEHWNECNTHAQTLRESIKTLKAVAEAAVRMWNSDGLTDDLVQSLQNAGYSVEIGEHL